MFLLKSNEILYNICLKLGVTQCILIITNYKIFMVVD
jgi:hypothetical protein